MHIPYAYITHVTHPYTGILNKAKAELKAVMDKLEILDKAYNDAVEKKDQLEKKEASCKVQLVNADKLVSSSKMIFALYILYVCIYILTYIMKWV